MPSKFLLLLVLGAGIASAAKKTYLANFDKPKPDGSSPIPGIYKGLNYVNMTFGPYDYAANSCVGICAHSYPLEAATGQGYPDFPGEMTVSGTKATSFALDILWFACSAESGPQRYMNGTEYTGPGPANCTLTVKGYKSLKATKPDVTSRTVYKPDVFYLRGFPIGSADMINVTFSKEWAGLKSVTFSAKLGAGYEGLLLYYDDVSYAVTSI